MDVRNGSANANAAKVKPKPKPKPGPKSGAGERYHHGDLRAALICAGLELIKERAADELSLREVARFVGVSATAVYRHFPNKQAFLRILGEEAAAEMSAALEAGRAGGKSSKGAQTSKGSSGKEGDKNAFVAIGRAYIYFALGNPGLYRFMVSAGRTDGIFVRDDHGTSGALQVLQDYTGLLLDSAASDFDRRVTNIHVCSALHGLVMLILAGHISPDGDVTDAMLDLVVSV